MRKIAKACIFAAAALLGACGNPSGQASQVVARVNDAEITLSQLRVALQDRKAGTVTTADARKAIDDLVDEQLLYAAALRSELDRDPGVVQTLEALRRQMLARAYLERRVFARETVSEAQKIDYYNKHPALFSERRIFQVIACELPAEPLDAALQVELGAARDFARVSGLLKAHSITCEPQHLIRAAEQLPLDELEQFQAARVGDVIVSGAAGAPRALMWIEDWRASPITLDRAQPIIEQYLVHAHEQQALSAYLQQSRALAKISYYYGGDSEPAAPQSSSAPALRPAMSRSDPANGSSSAVLN